MIYGAISAATGANVSRRAREVYERASWPVERMHAFRLECLRSLMAHAEASVPYYNEIFRSCGFAPAAVSGFTDLAAIPVLTRGALIHSFGRLQDPGAKPSDLMRVSTGGTTGTPVTVLLDRGNAIERMLVNHRMYALMGRDLGEPTLLIAGSPIDFVAWRSLRDRVKNRLFGVSVRSSFRLDAGEIQALLRDMKTGRFSFVIAYASVFDILASHLERSGDVIRLEGIVPCAEPVTQAQRERWGKVFFAEIFEIYGSREMSSLAGETRDHDAMVVNGDLYHVEITDELGKCVPDGEPGLITVTALLERGMPLIRYQLGDLGVLLPRSARDKLPFARLKITHGRVLDVICCPDGKLLPGEFFPHLMKEVTDQVERYQVVQEAIDRLVVKVLRNERYRDATTEYLKAKVRDQMGQGVTIEVVFVESLENSASGKFRTTISKVPWERKLAMGRPTPSLGDDGAAP